MEIESLFLTNELEIEDVKVRVGIKFSKYFSLSREISSVNFNQRHFEQIFANIDTIKENLEKKTKYTLQLSPTKMVGTMDVSNANDGEPWVEFINFALKHQRIELTKDQFMAFADNILTIRKWFGANIVYRHADGTNWSLHPDKARQGLEPVPTHQLWRRLVNRACNKCLVFMLRAFALKAKIFKIAARQCFGCVNEKSSQKDHMEAGCLSPIEDLMVYYEDALRDINFPDVLKRLCLEMVWPCPKLPHVASSHMVKEIVCNRLDVLCDECKLLMPLYDDLFEFMEFDEE